MIIKIKIEPEQNAEKTLNYFYKSCLDLYLLEEIKEFEVGIEGTSFKRVRKNGD